MIGRFQALTVPTNPILNNGGCGALCSNRFTLIKGILGHARHPFKRVSPVSGFCRPIHLLISGFLTPAMLLITKEYHTDPSSHTASAMLSPPVEVPTQGPFVTFFTSGVLTSFRQEVALQTQPRYPSLTGPHPRVMGAQRPGMPKIWVIHFPLLDAVTENSQHCRCSQCPSNIWRTAFQ